MTEDLAKSFDQLLELAKKIGTEDDKVDIENCRKEVILNLSTICEESLSEEETGDAITFLQSPTGRKLMEILPKLQESIVKSLDEFLARMKEKAIEEMISEVMEEMPGVIVIGVKGPEIRTKKGGRIPYNCG